MKTQFLIIVSILILFVNNLIAENWTEKNKVAASDRAENDYFGQSVDIDGDYAIVGAYGENNYTGAAYIFKKNSSGEWAQIAKLTASDGAEEDYFGYSVAISGNFAIVGAYQEDEDATNDNTVNNSGSVYIFKNDGNDNWTQTQKRVATSTTRTADDHFGYSVSMDEDYAVIGATGRSYVYILKKELGDAWNEIGIIHSSTEPPGNLFGCSVAIEKSSLTIIVGAESETTDENDENSLGLAGCVYVFNTDGNDHFTQRQKIVPTAQYRTTRAYFGHSVSICGSYMLIGAYGELNSYGSGLYSGAAYIFQKEGIGNWTQNCRISAGNDADENDNFGYSVSINGNIAVAGAHGEEYDASGNNYKPSAGAVYIFNNDGSGNWGLANKIVASDRSTNDYLGWSVAIDGGWLISGANEDEKDASGSNPIVFAGSAYFFTNETITEYYVSTSGNDATGNGSSTSPWASIQKAVNSFSDSSVANTVHLENGVYIETVSIDRNFSNLTLSGANAKLTVIEAAESVNDAHASVFTVADGNTVRFENMRIRYGNTTGNGGGICNGTGSINIYNCTLQENQSLSMGGGVYNNGTCVVSNSTFTGNKASVCGGAYAGYATVKDEITNSTFFDNSGFNGANGGAIFFATAGSSNFYVTNCTIAYNSTGSSGGEGGGIYIMGGTLSIKNTILANNQKAGSDNDFYQDGGTIVDNGYNIVETSGGYTFSATGDLTGTSLTLNLASTLDYNNTTNGTKTLKTMSGSVAIDAGNSSANGTVAVPTQDQRGAGRNGTTDIGAYEFYENGSTPVELVSFSANVFQSSVKLSWQTATEVNNYGFQVERKKAKVESKWENIGFVEGAGNSNSPKEYSFTDENPPSGNVQYRLKQIDIDGAFQYSEIVEVGINLPEKFELYQNYPNPFNPTTTISYVIANPDVIGVKQSIGNSAFANNSIDCRASLRSARNDRAVQVSLKIYDALGREVATLINKKQAPGKYSIQFEATDMPSGIYFYTLRAGNLVKTKKMILMK